MVLSVIAVVFNLLLVVTLLFCRKRAETQISDGQVEAEDETSI